MPIRAVLFDWGGTLIRDDALSFASPSAAVAHYLRTTVGLPLQDEQFEQALQAALPEYRPGDTTTSPAIGTLIRHALALLGSPATEADILACSSLFFRQCTAGQQLFDDARALLSSLRYRGYRTGVVTNTIFPSSLLVAQMRALGVAGYLDTIVASADDGLAKPHPAPFLRALADLGVAPGEALFVGDSLVTDVAGATAAGMQPVLLSRRGGVEPDHCPTIQRLFGLNSILGEGPVG
jgi:HAD superfamily hydrolase (TIGR01549 family)